MIAAVSIEGLVGTAAAFDIDIHNARPHKGQIKVGFYERCSQNGLTLCLNQLVLSSERSK